MRASKRSRLYRQDDAADRATRDRVLIMNGLPLDLYLVTCTGICAGTALTTEQPWLWSVTVGLAIITALITVAMRL